MKTNISELTWSIPHQATGQFQLEFVIEAVFYSWTTDDAKWHWQQTMNGLRSSALLLLECKNSGEGQH